MGLAAGRTTTQGPPLPTGPTQPVTAAPAPAGGGGDPHALIQQWQASHPYGSPGSTVQDLNAFLQSQGIQTQIPTHAGGVLSTDKIVLPDQSVIDVSNDNGWQWSPDGYWVDGQPSATPNVVTQAPGGGGGLSGLGLAGPLGNGLNGVPGAGDLNQYLPLPTGLTLANDPGYQARLKLGTDAIQNAAAAKGSLLSGKTLADLSDYGQTQASNEYGAAFDRALNSQNAVFGRNFNLANLGLNAAGDLSSAYGTNAANQSGLVTNQSTANAANTINQGNSVAQSASDIAKAAMSNYYAGKFQTPPPGVTPQQPTPVGTRPTPFVAPMPVY
jgi:hypothetical protein